MKMKKPMKMKNQKKKNKIRLWLDCLMGILPKTKEEWKDLISHAKKEGEDIVPVLDDTEIVRIKLPEGIQQYPQTPTPTTTTTKAETTGTVGKTYTQLPPSVMSTDTVDSPPHEPEEREPEVKKDNICREYIRLPKHERKEVPVCYMI
jgi:hypothetical protein